MSASEMVTVFLSFTIPIVVMNLLFFILGLFMRPSWLDRWVEGKKDEKASNTEKEDLLTQLVESDKEDRKELMKILSDLADKEEVDVSELDDQSVEVVEDSELDNQPVKVEEETEVDEEDH